MSDKLKSRLTREKTFRMGWDYVCYYLSSYLLILIYSFFLLFWIQEPQ